MAEEKAKDKKSIGLSLKSAIPTSDDSEEEDVEGSEAENLTLFVRKFKRFMKKKNPKGKKIQQKKIFKKNEPNSSNFTCFECEKPNRIKFECSIYLKKQQNGEKKSRSHNKNY